MNFSKVLLGGFIKRRDGMKCEIFNIRLSKEYKERDILTLNEFLKDIDPYRIFSSVILGDTPSWSVLIFYKDKKREIFYKEGMEKPILNPTEERLYEVLRRWRNEQAINEHVPPYIIAHNSWLKRIAKMHIKTKEELLCIKGFGKKRIEKYGDDILREVQEFWSNERI